jgi:pyrroline-5-carboxylate reductase
MSLSGKRVVFLGAGNMAEALVKGIVGRGAVLPSQVTVTDVRPERLDAFADAFGVRGLKDNREAAAEADILILAVKPQDLAGVLEGIRGAVPRTCLVISMAAGKTTSWIGGLLGDRKRVVRVMPNTPALVGAGASALCAGAAAGEKDLAVAELLFATVGCVVRVEEADMDAVTAVSGSGPAYVFFLIEAALEAASRLGLEAGVARRLIVSTVEGAARLIDATGETAQVLRERVTSKGGTTAAAFEVLRKDGAFEIWVQAILAAHARSRELSRAN